MKIFYNNKTGEVIGTVDGFGESKIGTIVPGGVDPEDIGVEEIELGSPKEELARKLMNPEDPLNFLQLKVRDGEVVELGDEEKKELRVKLDKEEKDRQKREADRKAEPSLAERVATLEKLLADQNK